MPPSGNVIPRVSARWIRWFHLGALLSPRYVTHVTQDDLQLLVVRTTAVASEALEVLLEERGALGSAVERRRGARLVRLQAYFPLEIDPPVDWVREKLAEMHAYGVPVGPAEVRLMPLRAEDWAESWKRHFHAFRATNRLWVVPTWEAPPGEAQEIIRMDPGMAFGQGDHPTTRGCLEMLERIAVGSPTPGAGEFATADVGTGTGILAIRAVQLGLGPVEAFDTEAEAVRAAQENATANGVANEIAFRQGTMPARGGGIHERILANIFLGPLTALFPRFARALIPGGELILAGILVEQEERLTGTARERGFVVIDRICERGQPGARRWPILRLRKEGERRG
jgi:ribosomal protein L11 methyltransferase